MTIPEWEEVRQIDVFRRERDKRPLPRTGAPQNLHVLVRGKVELPPGRCVLRLSADDCCHAWLDGKWLGQGPAPAYHDRYYYQEHPVKGGRTVTVALHLYYQGLVNRAWNSGDGRFGVWACFVQDGKELARCDESWRYQICSAYSGEAAGDGTQFLEDFDSRLWPEGWERPRFDDSAWGRLVPALWADYGLSRQPTAGLTRERVDAVERRPVPGGVLLDFGRERAGTLHAAAKGRAGETIALRFGEELDGAGRVRYGARRGCRYEEVWTLGRGKSVLHQYDYKAFRYVELLGADVDAKLAECWVWERHYPMEDGLCTLSCGQDELEGIFQICKTAVRCGAQEGYLSDLARGKGQRLGDAVVAARSQVWLTGKTDLLRKCVRDFMASGRVTPSLMASAPGSRMEEGTEDSLLFPALPLTDWDFTGDREFLWECYAAVKGIAACFSQYQRPDGLLEDADSTVNALWYGFLLMKERMERALGLSRTIASGRVGRAFRRAFWRPERELFADRETGGGCSLEANLYPACFGLTPGEGADAYEKLLRAPGQACGPFHMYFALRGLGRLGRYEALYRLLTRADGYGWRSMLREGATACFGDWGGDRAQDASLCCPGAGGALPIFIEELAGIRPDPDAPGGFRFQPHLPAKLDDLALQAPFRGLMLSVRQEDWRAALTVRPLSGGRPV